ncbi:putative aspartate racemase [Helianthus debilis subsp. tardiflorus]
MSLHPLNYPSRLLDKLTKPKRIHKTKMNITPVPERGNKPASKHNFGLNLASMSSKNSMKGSLLYQPNLVGIIGGMSPNVTLDFIKKLINTSNECKQDENGLPFVLCSDPIMNKVNDDTQIVEILRRKRVFLERSGARCIVMPCHLLHSWYEEVSKGCSVPMLHMGECVANELKEAKLKPLEAGSPLRIGVLATDSGGFYQDKLQKEGFEVILPDKATMEHAIIPSLEAISRKDIEGAQNLLRIALQVLLVRAVNIIILASDDVRTILPHDDPLLKKCVDPLDSLAPSTVKLAQSAIKCSQ